MGSESVLKRLLQKKPEAMAAEPIVKHFEESNPAPAFKKKAERKPGRPTKDDSKKARNFTLCLAPEFLKFLDSMVVKDTKIQGRGRKIRFIIERFIEHEKRSLGHMRVLKESLKSVQLELKGFEGRVKKGEKLELTIKERAIITKTVDQVMLLLKVLNYTPKALQKMLPREDWALLSFCLDWNSNKRVVL